MAKPTINPNELGDLVPKSVHEDNWPSLDMGPKYQEQLKEIAHKTVAVRNRWKCGLLPTLHSPATEISGDLYLFDTTACFCAVHLSGGNVGVLRMDACAKNCALFLRLKRADWFAWADKNKVPRSAGRVFTKRMDRDLGKKMLMDARAFKLGPSNVHHPSVLALLCTMSRHSWLPVASFGFTCDNKFSSIDEVDTFTLVALPPLPAEFEQCLGLLGHSAAFVKDNAGSDDDEVSLSTRNDAKPLDEAWGTDCPGDKVIGSLAHLFEEGATSIRQLAQPGLFMHGLSNFDSDSRDHACILEQMQSAANTKPLPPLYPGDETSYLDPSDDEGVFVAAVPAAAPAAPTAKAKAKSVAPRQRQQTQPKVRAPPKKKKKKKNGSDSDDSSDSDDTSESGSDTSEEEDATSSSGDDDDDNDDDDNDGSDSGSVNTRPPVDTTVNGAATAGGASSSSDSDSPSPMASRKRARTEPAPAVPAPAPSPGVTDLLIQMAKPCHEKLQRHLRSHGWSLLTRYSDQLQTDVELLQSASSPVALLAAALSIINTLTDVQADRARGSSTLVDRAEAQRLQEMLAAQTRKFSEAVRVLLEGASEA